MSLSRINPGIVPWLRGIGAIAVVVFHSNLTLSLLPVPQPHFIIMGRSCTDFFFVLSGFLITYAYADYFINFVRNAECWKYTKERAAPIIHFSALQELTRKDEAMSFRCRCAGSRERVSSRVERTVS